MAIEFGRNRCGNGGNWQRDFRAAIFGRSSGGRNGGGWRSLVWRLAFGVGGAVASHRQNFGSYRRRSNYRSRRRCQGRGSGLYFSDGAAWI
ncbi:MAG: hypothetical protein MGG37_08065 [Trichodesmium sp. MAG_R01]|nr:hypothetical protein [Trichodesmium sp. MAG_R01]